MSHRTKPDYRPALEQVESRTLLSVAGIHTAEVRPLAAQSVVGIGWVNWFNKVAKPTTPLYVFSVFNESGRPLKITVTVPQATGPLGGNIQPGTEVPDHGRFLLFTEDIDVHFNVAFASAYNPALQGKASLTADLAQETNYGKGGFILPVNRGWQTVDFTSAQSTQNEIVAKVVNRQEQLVMQPVTPVARR